jgi:alkanesulfonate monooxygenase SsuD/methylene tetrahydromethanopterin reductase-like flavin-dependent oxidoreductase (luciferase family)
MPADSLSTPMAHNDLSPREHVLTLIARETVAGDPEMPAQQLLDTFNADFDVATAVAQLVTAGALVVTTAEQEFTWRDGGLGARHAFVNTPKDVIVRLDAGVDDDKDGNV